MTAARAAAARSSAARGAFGVAKWKRSGELRSFAGTHANAKEVLTADDAVGEAHRVFGQSYHKFQSKAKPTGRLAEILSSSRFEWTLSLVICLNMASIVVETDISANGQPLPIWLTSVNIAFLVVYFIEFLLKVAVFRLAYFKDKWNWLDLGIIFTDAAVTAVNFWNGLERVSVMRVFRLVKLFRSVRVIRQIWELKVLLLGFQAAAKSIVFGMSMVLVMAVVWAILGVQLIHPVNTKIWENSDCHLCKAAFSSVWNSFLTIFQTVVAGDSWGTLAIPIINSQWWTSLWFLVVLVTVQLTMLNLILAVIVERAAEAREQEVQRQFMEQEYSMQQSKVQLIEICRQLDTDGSGEISAEEFLDGFENNPDFAAALLGMGVYPEDVGLLFDVVDTHGTGEVTYVTFVNTLARLRTQMNQVILFSVTELRKAVAEVQEDLRDLKRGRKAMDFTTNQVETNFSNLPESNQQMNFTANFEAAQITLDQTLARQVDELGEEMHRRLKELQQDVSESFHRAVQTLVETQLDSSPRAAETSNTPETSTTLEKLGNRSPEKKSADPPPPVPPPGFASPALRGAPTCDPGAMGRAEMCLDRSGGGREVRWKL